MLSQTLNHSAVRSHTRNRCIAWRFDSISKRVEWSFVTRQTNTVKVKGQLCAFQHGVQRTVGPIACVAHWIDSEVEHNDWRLPPGDSWVLALLQLPHWVCFFMNKWGRWSAFLRFHRNRNEDVRWHFILSIAFGCNQFSLDLASCPKTARTGSSMPANLASTRRLENRWMDEWMPLGEPTSPWS